jgi:hypothetical protein
MGAHCEEDRGGWCVVHALGIVRPEAFLYEEVWRGIKAGPNKIAGPSEIVQVLDAKVQVEVEVEVVTYGQVVVHGDDVVGHVEIVPRPT